MKICMFTSSFLPTIGGLQYQVKWLAEGIAEQGEQIYLLTPNDASAYIEQKNNFPKNVTLAFGKSYFLNIIKFRKAIKQIKPDVIHVPSVIPDGFYAIIATLFMNVPIIITSHGIDIVTIKEINYGYRLNPIYAIIIKAVLRRCDKHVVVSNSMIAFAIEAGSSMDRLCKIHDIAPPAKRNISAQAIEKVRKKYNINNSKTILTLSGMRPIKGLEYLIKAMPIVREKNPDTRLLMTCRGEDEDYIRNLVLEIGVQDNVDFIGFIEGEEKDVLTCICDVFCMPSLYESFGIAILDAMQYGTAVVASDTGGIPEIIENGKNGLLCKPKDHVQLAESINALLEDKELNRRIGEAGKSSMHRFDVRRISEEYISIYKEVVE